MSTARAIAPVLELAGIGKSFSGIPVLEDGSCASTRARSMR